MKKKKTNSLSKLVIIHRSTVNTMDCAVENIKKKKQQKKRLRKEINKEQVTS